MQQCLVVNICCIFVYIYEQPSTFTGAYKFDYPSNRKFMKQRILAPVLCLLFAVCMTNCEKAEYKVVTNFKVKLTSLPYEANEVNLNIEKVQVSYGDTSWTDLETPDATYNLLAFQNDADTTISLGKLLATSIVTKLRLTIGAKNSINFGGKLMPLMVDSMSRQVVLTVNKKLNRNVETVTLVFDPAASVFQYESGYTFTPLVTIRQGKPSTQAP